MSHPIAVRFLYPVLSGLFAVAAWLSAHGALGMPGAIASWGALMVLPGLALYLLVESSPRPLEAVVAGVTLSPVITTAVASLTLHASDAGPVDAVRLSVLAVAVLAAAGTVRARVWTAGIGAKEWWALAAFIVGICALTAYLPMTDEWWRIRSDAWAHRAYIAQLAEFGFPLEDPYFLGMPLQYMWFYHVLVLTMATAMNVDPFWVMAFVNVQVLAGLAAATYLFAAAWPTRASQRIASVATVTFGLNAAFWVFLPVKLARAFTGEVRGMEEVSRVLSLSPLTYQRAMEFMRVVRNKEFFLDKFMVATAFGIGLCLMAVVWWAAVSYLRTGRRSSALVLFVALVGAIGFHTFVGFAMSAAILAALVLLFLVRRRLQDFSAARSAVVAVVVVAAALVMVPYLGSVMGAKESTGQISAWLFIQKSLSVFVSVAGVLMLFLFQRRFRSPYMFPDAFVVGCAAAVTIVVLAAPLPGPNAFDKPAFFVFFPLAAIGGWTLADWAEKAGTRWRRAVAAAGLALLFFGPVNAIAFAGCFNEPSRRQTTPREEVVGAWLRTNTPRTAVLLDDSDEMAFAVIVPRRYLWGRMAYADQWGYDRLEMSRRYHAWRTVYSKRPLDRVTLETLASVDEEFFVLVRSRKHGPAINALRHPEYFRPVHDDGSFVVARVDTRRCREDAASGRFPTVTEEELLRESGLE